MYYDNKHIISLIVCISKIKSTKMFRLSIADGVLVLLNIPSKKPLAMQTAFDI